MTDTYEPAYANRAATRRPRRMARDPKPETAEQVVAPGPIKRATKTELVVSLLQRREGATIAELVAATGWLPHTTRAALTGLKKKGHVVHSEKVEDLRHYRIVGGAA